ncbi:MAG: phosphoribosyl-ATP diphosphatase [Myxococcota bacterium]
MIVPSIDLRHGQAVQLVGGAEPAIEAGDPVPLAQQFGVVGPIAVIDLGAALGDEVQHTETITHLCQVARCRVGGGLRTIDKAKAWLDRGAEQIIIGTAATPEFVRQLPRERVIAALDAVDGEVVVEGWRTKTGRSILEGMAELRDHVGGFLVTFVEREGRLQGTDLERVAALVEAAGDAELTIAGGVSSIEEIRALDELGVDAQVGMALYTGRFTAGASVAGLLKTDRPDGLFPTVVTDESGVALGLAYSSAATLAEAIDTRTGIYHSRRRGRWQKGATSGAVQELIAVDLDCDRDTVRFTVRQAAPGFCHENTWTCWGDAGGVPALARTLASRVTSAPAGSYTRRLLDDPELLASKLREEAQELIEASTPAEVAHEVADVVFFALVAMVRAGVPWSEVEAVLDRRSRRVTRRPGHAKH